MSASMHSELGTLSVQYFRFWVLLALLFCICSVLMLYNNIHIHTYLVVTLWKLGAFRNKNKNWDILCTKLLLHVDARQTCWWLTDFHKQTKLPGVLHSGVPLNIFHHSAVILLWNPATPFFNWTSVAITCVKWAPRPARGAWILAGTDTCLHSAVPATLDRMWLINRPVLITGTLLMGVAVTWIPRWGDNKLQGKCNGFCYIATHWDSELHQRPDVITCPQDAGSVFYYDYSENQVSAQIVMLFSSIAPVFIYHVHWKKGQQRAADRLLHMSATISYLKCWR